MFPVHLVHLVAGGLRMVSAGCHLITGMSPSLNITSARLGKRCRLIRVILPMLVAVTCMIAANSASAQLGASEEQLGRFLGTPVKKSGDLIYYHKSPRNLVAHMYHGACDQICIFSDKESQGFPVALTDDEIQNLLRDFGGGMVWFPVSRVSLNRVWNSRDGRSFAIYETMHNKLVMMTRDAYCREKHGSSQEKGM